MDRFITLGQFIIERQSDFPYAKGELSRLLRDISIAAKIVNREVNKAGLADILGKTGTTNVQGEEVKKLDMFANEAFIAALSTGGECCVIASEENEDIIPIYSEVSRNAKYVVLFDPLDGSGNVDVNASLGTIFSIYRRNTSEGPGLKSDVLQRGSEQVASGYVIYGSSTMMVYTTGHGVNGFTYDPSIGEFCLSHPDMTIPFDGRIYSVNEGNYNKFPQGIKDYIKYCQDEDETTNRPYAARYIGAMVADIHRIFIQGGVFIYPASNEYPTGKLRLMYECNPLAFLVEQGGGKATNGSKRILDIKPTEVHGRSSIIIGSRGMVEKAESFCNVYEKSKVAV